MGDAFPPYQTRKDELSVQDGVLLCGSRIIVPSKMRQCVLDELHESHPGIVKKKSLARHYVWWPKMDADIEQVVRACDACESTRSSPAVAPLHPWEWPQRLWSRLHADFAGPFHGHMFLIVVDA